MCRVRNARRNYIYGPRLSQLRGVFMFRLRPPELKRVVLRFAECGHEEARCAADWKKGLCPGPVSSQTAGEARGQSRS